jgi:MinD-like ATPase involved in chromosome partitioning or flagellar assembly
VTDRDNSDFAEKQIAQPGAPQAAPPPPPYPGRPPAGYPGYQPYQQAPGQVRRGAEHGPHPGAHRADAPTGWGVPPRPAQRADAPAWDPQREGAPPPPYWGDTGPQQLPARWTPAALSGRPGVNWSYVDQIRTSELVPTRKIPPGRGWRRAVYTATFGMVNLGQSPDELRQAELGAKIRTLLRGGYKIGVLGKGGVGKTTIAACVGSVFAQLRQEDRVVAIDADTAFGKLGSRIDPTASGSYWELASDQHLYSFADVRSRVGANAVGLFVLAGEACTARRRVLDSAVYREAASRLDNHFTISIIDCGSTLDAPVTQEVLRDLDALIVVSSPWVDGASAAGQTMEWLANNGYTGLLHRTVVVLNDSDGHADKRTRSVLAEQFGSRGQTVIEILYDPHLRPGGVIDVDNELNRITRRRVYEIAAAIAEHFAAATDRPRERR